MMPLEKSLQTSQESAFSPLDKEEKESSHATSSNQSPVIPKNKPGKHESEVKTDHNKTGNIGNVGNISNVGNIGNVGKGKVGEIEIKGVLEEVEKKGFSLSLEGSSLRVKPSGLPEDLRNMLQQMKEEIVNFLSSSESQAPSTSSFPEVFSTADFILSQLPNTDTDHHYILRLVDRARRTMATDADIERLSRALLDVYGRKFDPDFRAAIWGGQTWREANKK